jgi:monovalent cation/hydrogen antiporter
MALFEWILLLLLAAVLLTLLAGRLSVPYPSLLAIAGTGLAFLPFAPDIRIEPDLALALFIAPALLDAGFDTSPRELKRNAIPIAALAVGAVIITTAAVAFVGWHFAGLSLGAAVALGAIVAPPDAAAAGAVLRGVRLPQRVGLILQGESLLNDATALLIYRVAVMVTVGSFSLTSDTPILLLSAAGSVVAGYVLGRLYVPAVMYVNDVASSIVLQFVTAYGIWLLADGLKLSPIITMVVYAMTLAQTVPGRSDPRRRISSYSVWETAIFVVNVLAFVLMGLQARPIIERLSEEQRVSSLMLGLAVLAVVIVVRILWVACYRTIAMLFQRWLRTPIDPRVTARLVGGSVLISWSGMRGLVTLATAFALPDDFPSRDLIVLCAFCVVLGTLVIQGLSLNPLLRWLKLEDGGALEQQLSKARVLVMQAALDSLDGDDTPAAMVVRKQYLAARTIAEDPSAPQGATEYDRLRLRATAAQRQALHRLRTQGEIADDIFHRLEEELDWSELDASPAGRFQPLMT